MTNQPIKFNTYGKILQGEDVSWYVFVVENDHIKKIGYYIYISKEPNTHCEVMDYWVECYNDIVCFFKESNWKIQWLDEIK